MGDKGGGGGGDKGGIGCLPSKAWGASKDNSLSPLGTHIRAEFLLGFALCKWLHPVSVSK